MDMCLSVLFITHFGVQTLSKILIINRVHSPVAEKTSFKSEARMVLFIYFFALFVIYIAYGYKKFSDKVARSKHIPGPPALPFIGNGLMFIGKTAVEITEIQMKNAYAFGDFSKMFLGPELFVLLGNPKDVEVLLSSQTLIDKSSEYDFAREWFGDGLLFSTGKKWFTRRRLVTPTFHFKILDQFVEVFDRNSSIFVNQLAKHMGKTVDVYPMITLCALVITLNDLRTQFISKLLGHYLRNFNGRSDKRSNKFWFKLRHRSSRVRNRK